MNSPTKSSKPSNESSRSSVNSPTKLTKSSNPYRSPFKTKYRRSGIKRVQKWSPRLSFGGGQTTPRGHKIHSPSPYFNSKTKKSDPTKNWDLNALKTIADNEVFVNNITEMLQEMNVFLIRKIVKVLGKKVAIDVMKTTHAIQSLGGLDLPTTSKAGPFPKTRRTKRTIGGVFIKIAKDKIPIDQWKEINQASEKNKPKKIKRKGMTPRSTPRTSSRSVRKSSMSNPRVLFGSDLPGETGKRGSLGRVNLSKEFQSIKLNETLPKTPILPITPPRPKTQSYDPISDKQRIGETLFPHVKAQQPAYARKITGMLLEGLDNTRLSNLLDEPNHLKNAVDEALRQYKEAVEPENSREKIGEQLYHKVKSSVDVQEQKFIGKITGMLLEMGDQNQALLLQVLESPDALTYYIKILLELLHQEKQTLGNTLYSKVQLHTTNAKKVTGMLLELDSSYVRELLACPYKLKDKIEECLSILGANDLAINFVTPFPKSRKCPR
jgi:hypothetical protein